MYPRMYAFRSRFACGFRRAGNAPTFSGTTTSTGAAILGSRFVRIAIIPILLLDPNRTRHRSHNQPLTPQIAIILSGNLTPRVAILHPNLVSPSRRNRPATPRTAFLS
jgi:hypothetical protein